MIEAEYTIDLDVPVERVWEYVEVIPNWAPHVIGYQKVDLVDDRRSVWTLRGDVGILTRTVDIQADITVWDPYKRAEFTITGLTERMSGQGSFELTRLDTEAGSGPADSHAGSGPADSHAGSGPAVADVGTADPAPVQPAAPKKDGLLRRLRFAVAGFFIRRLNKRAAARRTATAGSAATEPVTASAPAPTRVTAAGRSRLAFRLEVAPGGPMAPMIELLMAPMVEPAAQDFLTQLRVALEGGDAVRDA